MMADVASQLEANGLPTQFESAANQPEVDHSTTNSVAVISNAEISQIKQDAPGLQVTDTAPAVQPVQESEHDQAVKAEVATESNAAPANDATPQINGHFETEKPTPVPTEPVTDIPMNESIPEGLPSISEIVADQIPIIPEAPLSNLRTSPHADALPPEQVAKIEEQKHQIDNSAVPPPTEPVVDPMDATTESQLAAVSDTVADKIPSPPPAPEPAHAELPKETNGTAMPSLDASEPKVEVPAAPTPTPAPIQSQDQEMTDAPVSSLEAVPSIKHDRDEDMTDEPSAKRARTDDEDTPLADRVPSQSAVTTATPSQSTPALPSDPNDAVTPLRLTHMKKVITNIKKSKVSFAFRQPVDPVALNIPTYFNYVTRPMDVGTIDDQLKRGHYTSVQAFKDDFNQIVANCVLFNGPDHEVTKAARTMENSFTSQMNNLPPPSLPEPTKEQKKANKTKLEPVRAPPPRRQSVNTKTSSPKASSPATFAPGPDGVPLLRRQSEVDRPKRAIIPTKRNSDFGGARPKKKKYELELRFCDEALKVISSPKYWQANQYFTHPVDPVALNIPTYFQVVKKPMDLATVRSKLDNGMYERAKDFEEDVRLIFKNCYKFNPEGDYVYQRGQELEKLFSQEWSKKQDWISAREPGSETASVNSDDEDEEAEPESDEDEGADDIARLQAQLELVQSQMAELKKKKKSPGAKIKKDKKEKKSVSKFPGLAKDKKKLKKPEKEKRERYVTFAEKQYISNGIAMLPERPMQDALRIIQNSVPQLAGGEGGEIELDIEEVPNHALLKLLAHVRKYAGPPPEEAREVEYSAPVVTKKNKKSMSKHEQEAHIAELKGQLHSYEKTSSPDAMQSIETGGEDSDDDSGESSEEE